MQTTDWAEDAHDFFLEYHRRHFAADDDELDPSVVERPRFFPDDEAAVSLLRSSPLLSQIDLSDLKDGPFSRFEEVRGWNVVLRRIGSDPVYGRSVSDGGRMLTLLRRNVRGPLFPKHDDDDDDDDDDRNNLSVVSRNKWALIECARWAAGCYDDVGARETVRRELRAHDDATAAAAVVAVDKVRATGSPDEGSGYGRYVECVAAARPGDVVHTAPAPYCRAPASIGERSSCCFHCARDLAWDDLDDESGAPSSSSSMVRNVSLLCELCRVQSTAYCSARCRSAHRDRHARECPLLPGLFEHEQELRSRRKQTRSSGRDSERTEEEEEGGMAPFKALLVLRAALAARHDPEQWRRMAELEHHRERHLRERPAYSADARSLAAWIAERLTAEETAAVAAPFEDDDDDGRDEEGEDVVVVRALQNVFFTIHVNAIGIGSDGVGLFPGTASMFNHSCRENVTHSWDRDGVLRFRAVDDVAPGEECTIGYVGALHLPNPERTEALSRHKFFTCRCRARCLREEEEKGDDGALARATRSWRDSAEALRRIEEQPDSNGGEETMRLRRRLCDAAEVLFPRHFVTKGACYEQLAAELSNARERGCSVSSSDERSMLSLFRTAKEQYLVCRGKDYPLVKRVDDLIRRQKELAASDRIQDDDDDDVVDFSKMGKQTSHHHDSSKETEDDEDLVQLKGWTDALLEVKTYEILSTHELEELSKKIKKLNLSDDRRCGNDNIQDFFVKWSEGFRVYEVGYGILTLILSCSVNEAEISRYDVSDMVQEQLDDVIQNVDVVG